MMLQVNEIYLGDCLDVMDAIDDKSIDMVLCDLPYGITACDWDVVIPLVPLWAQYKRIIKDHGAIVLTATQPFASELITSNPKMFRYEWIWEKNVATGFFNANKLPMRIHENVLIFGNSIRYIPQMTSGKSYFNKSHVKTPIYGNRTERIPTNNITGDRYPTTIIKQNVQTGLHPTQKPTYLFEYLINTYTDRDDLVLDNCAGSGTTAVACQNTNRRFILIEKDEKYYTEARQRIWGMFDKVLTPVGSSGD